MKKAQFLDAFLLVLLLAVPFVLLLAATPNSGNNTNTTKIASNFTENNTKLVEKTRELEIVKVKPLNESVFKFNVLGVAVNTLENKGIVTPFEFKVYSAKNGSIYLDTNSYKEISFQTAVAMAKEFVKYFLHLPIDNKDILINLKVNSPFVAGESGGVALTLGLIFAAKNYVPKNLDKYVFTGVIMPFGIIGEVGGINLKYLAAVEENKTLVHGNPTFMQGLFFTNILDLYKHLFGEQLLEKKTIKIPEWYKEITYKLEKQICEEAFKYNFTNSTNYKLYLKAMKNKAYYAAASLCFVYLMDHSNISVDPLELHNQILSLREQINNEISRVKTLYDAEALTAAQKRLELAMNYYEKYMNTGNESYLVKAYWRLQSAKGWLEFVGKTKGISYYCPKQVYEDEKKIYASVLSSIELPKITNDYQCYYEVKQTLANIHDYLFNYPSNVEALIKIAPYYFDRFDLIGYTSYELSQYLDNMKDKLYYIIRAIDFMHCYSNCSQ